MLLAVVGLCPARGDAASYQGFGASTPGGAGGAVVRVTNLRDNGPGSLRAALAGGNRTIVFDVAGDIVLSDYLYVGGAFVTIDGFSAPAPGITLRNRGLVIRGIRGAHDVIVRGLRVRDSPLDGIQVSYGAYNVVIDHVSVQGSGDGDLDITEGSHDVTVSWSLFAEPLSGKTMLIKYNAARVSLHHNLFVRVLTRNPNVAVDNASTPATDTTLDMRNNVVWDWGYGWGTQVHYGVRANVVQNFYASPASRASDRRNALLVDTGTARVHVSGNVSGDGVDLSGLGNERTPFPAPAVDTQEACAAAAAVLTGAGVRPLDALDQQYLARVTLPPCSSVASTLSVLPAGIDLVATAGGPPPAPVTMTIADAAGQGLAWTATAGSATWLSLRPTSGTTPSGLTITADATALEPGTYTTAIRVQAPGSTAAPVTVPVSLTVPPPILTGSTVRLPVAGALDDAGEHLTGTARTRERALKAGRSYLLAFRFEGVPVPRGARLVSAVLKLYALAPGTGSIVLRYAGEAADDSPPLADASRNLSGRPVTAAFVDDVPPPWRVGGLNASPDLAAVVQEIVDRPGWAPGHALTLFVADDGSTGSRSVATFDRTGSSAQAAVLELSFR